MARAWSAPALTWRSSSQRRASPGGASSAGPVACFPASRVLLCSSRCRKAAILPRRACVSLMSPLPLLDAPNSSHGVASHHPVSAMSRPELERVAFGSSVGEEVGSCGSGWSCCPPGIAKPGKLVGDANGEVGLLKFGRQHRPGVGLDLEVRHVVLDRLAQTFEDAVLRRFEPAELFQIDRDVKVDAPFAVRLLPLL